MDDTNAVAALEDLGLTSYEAQVFVALQRLGVGSAGKIDDVADVPRSQVYGAAENLEERGLVEVQQSSPLRYRAVELDEARERLRNRYERREERAFDVLEEVRDRRQDVDERQEDVWTVHGREAVTARTRELVADAEGCVLFGTGPELLEDDLVEALCDRGAADVSVTVISADDAVRSAFEDCEGVAAHAFPADLVPEAEETGRILVVDGETVLLSVFDEARPPEEGAETAIWSAETGFAAVFVRLLDAHFEEYLDVNRDLDENE